MRRFGPRGIRGRITLMAGVVTALAMALIVVVMGFAANFIHENAIADSLRERLEQAREAVSAGDYDLVIDLAGNEVLQVIDSDGNVVAGSRNARGLAAITHDEGDDDDAEVDELEFKRSEDAAAAEPAPADTSQPEPTVAAPSAADVGGGQGQNAAKAGRAADKGHDDGDSDDAENARGSAGTGGASAGEAASGNASGVEPDDDGDDDDDDDDDDDGKDDDGKDNDDDDDDSKSSKSSKSSKASKASKAGASGKSKSSHGHIAWPFAPTLAWAEEAQGQTAPDVTVDAAAVLGAEGPYLILKDQVESPDGLMTVVAVTSLAQARRQAAEMAWILAAIMVAVLVVVIALTWVLTGRTLRPVEQMRAKAESITAENLSERIEVPSGDADLTPLAETLNEMLGRVGQSLAEEKRFISDASHELKSPLAATAVILDALRTHPDEIDLDQAIEDLSSENARMTSIVGDMLAITRYDEGRLRCEVGPLDVMDIVLEEAMALKARTAVEVDVRDAQPITCRADAELLSHALRNVLDNAARYADSLVKVSCELDDDGATVIQVSDDGCGIAPEDRERVFGRFVCLDERSGTGLGLAVARGAIEAHGGTLCFVDPILKGATAQITLP